MFIIFLRFTAHRERSKDFLDDHKTWLKLGFENNQVLLAGSIEPSTGGCIVVQNMSHKEAIAWVNEDPFVKENIVLPEIIEVTVSMTQQTLEFLKSDNERE